MFFNFALTNYLHLCCWCKPYSFSRILGFQWILTKNRGAVHYNVHYSTVCVNDWGHWAGIFFPLAHSPLWESGLLNAKLSGLHRACPTNLSLARSQDTWQIGLLVGEPALYYFTGNWTEILGKEWRVYNDQLNRVEVLTKFGFAVSFFKSWFWNPTPETCL